MAIVDLSILSPTHHGHHVGNSDVHFVAQLNTDITTTLYYAWFSSLRVVDDLNDVPLNRSSDNPFDFTKPLTVGTHVITLTVKDRAGNAQSDWAAVIDSGMAGGPLDAEHPCLFHVYIADMPPLPSTTLNKAMTTLLAVAPSKWGKPNNSDGYDPDPQYTTINRLRYRWRFVPSGAPANRQTDQLIPDMHALSFSIDDDTPLFTYQGPLPNSLDLGNYTMTLRVEDKENNAIGHEVSMPVTIVT